MSKTTRPALKMPEKRQAVQEAAEAWVQQGRGQEAPQPAAAPPVRPSGGKLARLNVELPQELHRQFKTACAAQGVKMAEIVTDLVRTWADARR